MPFVVHQLGDRLYGFWSLASVFIGYYTLLDLGLSSAVSQYVCVAIGRNDLEECRAVFNAAIKIQSILGGIALIATLAIAAMTPLFTHIAEDAHLFRRVIIILGVSAALTFPVKVYGGVLDAQYRFDINAYLAILGSALRTGLVVCAIWAGGRLLALAWMTGLASLPVAALQIWFGRREAPWARIVAKFETGKVKSLFSYSIYSFLSYLADILRFQVDPLVISGLIGLAAITHYRVASVFSQQYFLQLLVVSVGILGPVFSRLHGTGDRAQMEAVFFFGTKLSCCISFFICFALMAWGRPFITRWMGPKYLDAYLPLAILAISVFLDVCQRSSIDLLYATFKHRFYTYLNWAEGALNLAFSLALARPLGIVGVALGTLIAAFVVRVIVQPWWVCRVSKLHYVNYMRFWGRTLLNCGLLTGVVLAASAWGMRPSYPMLIGSAFLATALYAGGSWLFILNPSERGKLFAAITNRHEVESAAGVAAL
jgi:O-antigen/teichoic acid export membrane protein